jgi:hypothetical protein
MGNATMVSGPFGVLTGLQVPIWALPSELSASNS